jgi:hypothetical protein
MGSSHRFGCACPCVRSRGRARGTSALGAKPVASCCSRPPAFFHPRNWFAHGKVSHSRGACLQLLSPSSHCSSSIAQRVSQAARTNPAFPRLAACSLQHVVSSSMAVSVVAHASRINRRKAAACAQGRWGDRGESPSGSSRHSAIHTRTQAKNSCRDRSFAREAEVAGSSA